MNEPLFHHTKQQEPCPQCGLPLQIKQGKKGLFLGCSSYPACDYIKPLQPYEHKVIKQLEQCCPECHHPLLLKQGAFGMFIGCSHYPDCHFVVHEEERAEEAQNVCCPECRLGRLVARRGRQGKYFYACNRFPHCRFTLAHRPYAVQCPACGSVAATLKNSAKSDRTFICANRTCRHQFEAEI